MRISRRNDYKRTGFTDKVIITDSVMVLASDKIKKLSIVMKMNFELG